MSQAPTEAVDDSERADVAAFRRANARREEMLRNGVSNSGHERNCCFLNVRDGTFANVSAVAGLDFIGDGRALATVDWDHDGDLDLWTTNRTGPRLQLLRNNLDQNKHFLSVRLQGDGVASSRDAIGASVEAVTDRNRNGSAARSVKSLRAGEGFLSQTSKWIHFGLGEDESIDRVIVSWPGGAVEEFANLKPNRHYVLAQGNGTAEEWSRPTTARRFEASTYKPRDATRQARIPLRYRIPLPGLTYQSWAGLKQTLDRRGRPMLVSLWASWCRPCLSELIAFRDSRKRLEEAGLRIAALSVDGLASDEGADPDAARDLLERLEFPFPAGHATDDFVAKVEAVFYYLFNYRRPWSVPTSLLIDARGELAVVYIGPVEVNQLVDDAARLKLGGMEWLAASLPFDGQWLDQPRHPNLTALVQTLVDDGFANDAVDFVDRFEEVLVGDADFSMLLANIAARLAEGGQTTDAKALLERSVAADADNAQAHVQLAKMYFEEGDSEGALRHSRMAVRLRPDSAAALFILADLLNREQRHEEALPHLEKLIELQPQLLGPRMFLGQVHASLLQWEEAAEHYGRAAQIAPAETEPHYQLARVLQKCGRPADAADAFDRALELAPDRANIRYSYASALIALNRRDDAIEQLRRANELQADTPIVLNGLAWLLASTAGLPPADYEEAVRVARRASELTGHKHPQILDTLASAYAAAGRFDEAVATAERAIGLARDSTSNNLTAEIEKRLELYRASRPYRE